MESKTNQTGSQEIKPGRGGKRPGAGRPKRSQAAPPAPQADQVAADRQAYDSKLGGTPPTPAPATEPPTTLVESEVAVDDQIAPPPATPEPRGVPPLDCAQVPRPH